MTIRLCAVLALALALLSSSVTAKSPAIRSAGHTAFLPLLGNGAAPPVPQLLAPADGSVLSTLAPELLWHSIAGQDAYQLHIATDPSFTTIVYSAAPSADFGVQTYTHILLSNLTPATRHYWRVGYEQPAGRLHWSAVLTFTTAPAGGTLPPAPTLLAPANGSTTVSRKPTLSWQAVSGANLYFSTVAQACGAFISAPSLELPFFLQASRTYTWSVFARNAYGWGPRSAKWTFTTPAD